MWHGRGMEMPALSQIGGEFYKDETKPEQHQQTHNLDHVQKGLQQSIQAFELIQEMRDMPPL